MQAKDTRPLAQREQFVPVSAECLQRSKLTPIRGLLYVEPRCRHHRHVVPGTDSSAEFLSRKNWETQPGGESHGRQPRAPSPGIVLAEVAQAVHAPSERPVVRVLAVLHPLSGLWRALGRRGGSAGGQAGRAAPFPAPVGSTPAGRFSRPLCSPGRCITHIASRSAETRFCVWKQSVKSSQGSHTEERPFVTTAQIQERRLEGVSVCLEQSWFQCVCPLKTDRQLGAPMQTAASEGDRRLWLRGGGCAPPVPRPDSGSQCRSPPHRLHSACSTRPSARQAI